MRARAAVMSGLGDEFRPSKPKAWHLFRDCARITKGVVPKMERFSRGPEKVLKGVFNSI